ncbi:MAG: diguanylate cyclase, partial [Acidobacteriota bacterium]
YVWPKRRAQGAVSFLLLTAASLLWVFLQALSALLVDDEAKILWSKLQYLGITAAPALALVFAIDFNGLFLRHQRVLFAALAIEPVLVMLALFTNDWHGLFWGDLEVVAGVPLKVLAYGPLFRIHTLYSYVVVLLSCGIAFWSFAQTPGWWRPSLLVAVGPLTVLGFNLLHLTGNSPFWGLDPSPIGISIAMAFVAVAVFRYRAFDLAPITRGEIYNRIDSAIVTVDSDDRVMDANQAARQIFELGDGAIFAAPLARILPTRLVSELDRIADRSVDTEIPVTRVRGRYFEGAIQQLDRRGSNSGGRVLIFRDITDRHRAEVLLLEAQRQLAAVNKELRTQANTDALTGLANRRFLIQQLARELEAADRSGTQLGLLMIDVDHFKQVNDRYGHHAGDRVLQSVARSIEESLRDGDLAARFGGEELVVLAPAAAAEGLAQLAERIRQSVAQARVDHDGTALGVTVSIGSALSSESPPETEDEETKLSAADALLARADERLYRAKAEGRDRVVGPSSG